MGHVRIHGIAVCRPAPLGIDPGGDFQNVMLHSPTDKFNPDYM